MAASHLPLRIDGGGVTLVIAGDGDRLPFAAYLGPSLPDGEDLEALAAAAAFPVAHAGLDVPYRPSLFPEASAGHFGRPALEAFSLGDDGGAVRWASLFRVAAVASDGESATVEAADPLAALGLTLTLSLAGGTGVLKATSRIENRGDRPLVVEALSAPAIPVPGDHATLLSWHGRWCGEFDRSAEPWPRGQRVLESRTGRTGHETFPGLVSLGPGAGETHGRALAVHLGWSGNWRMVAEDLANGHRAILAGVLPNPGEAVVPPGGSLESPPVYVAVSEDGLGAASRAFHREVRERLVRDAARRPRPVHFNSWEAVYFDLDVPTLVSLADAAAAIGAERFVVDDGWFPARHHDRAGLGDWTIDPAKFPDGFGPLIAHVHGLGMGFGLWVEPEMVNPDSDLCRAHPDWVLGMEGHPAVTARHQWVLDVARPAVSAYLFERLDALLSANRIDYLKWDMNRPLVTPGRNGRAVAIEQVEALYALMDRLRARHPGTEIESCSSGGGRMDFGILARTQRFWLSDNNDAHDRWRMNLEASVFFPPEVLGHHVGPAPAHTSGRRLDMAFRAASAAAFGHMGVEADVRALGAEERAALAAAIGLHKRWRAVLHAGAFHRLEPPAPFRGHMTVAADGDRFLAAVMQADTLVRSAGPMIRLAGLDPDARYRLAAPADTPFPKPRDRGFATPLTTPGGLVASGRALMTAGFRLPTGWPDQVWLVEGERIA